MINKYLLSYKGQCLTLRRYSRRLEETFDPDEWKLIYGGLMISIMDQETRVEHFSGVLFLHIRWCYSMESFFTQVLAYSKRDYK